MLDTKQVYQSISKINHLLFSGLLVVQDLTNDNLVFQEASTKNLASDACGTNFPSCLLCILIWGSLLSFHR